MRWIYKLPLRLRSLFRKNRVERELSDELRFHLEKLTEENVSKGRAPEEARFAALRELGGVEQIKEECRDMRRVNFIQDLLQDIRYGLRQLRRNPGFTAVAVITLALGIGANTAIFSVVNGILLQPLPFPQANRLVSVWQMGVPKGAVRAVQERSRTMVVAAYSWNQGVNLTRQGQSVQINGAQVSGNLFSVLGAVRPELGRAFRPSDETPGANHTVILSNAAWRNLFGAKPKIIGSWITLDDVPRQIVGVMPPSLRFPSSETDVWVPMELDSRNVGDFWGAFSFVLIGRLRPGVSVAGARAEFKMLIPQIVKLFPWRMAKGWGEGGDVIPLQQYLVGNVRTKLLILLGAVGLVLLIACANVANLLLTRSTMRQKEIAVRAALGAGRPRIVRQLLTESLLVAAGGGLLGFALAVDGLRLLRLILPANTPRLAGVGIDARVMIFTAALAILTGLVFGLAPALRVSRPDLEHVLRATSQTTGGDRGRRRLSSALVVGEAALAVLLVTGAGLLAKSLWKLSHVQTGLSPKHLLTASITPSQRLCKESARCVNFYDALLGRLRALHGVRAAAISDCIPFVANQTVLAVENNPLISAAHPYQTWEFQITPDYLRTMGIPLLKGRTFTAADRAGAPGVVLVSAALARHLWPGSDPIGKQVKPSWERGWRTVVGVVGDVRADALKPQSWSGGTGAVYFPYRQGIVSPPTKVTLVVRTVGDPSRIAEELPGLVAGVNPDVPVSHIRPMVDVMSASLSEPRSTMCLFAIFAILALTLGALGIYSVISYSVAERTHEIGVRMALGAQKNDVLSLVVGQGMALALIGVGIGVAAALGLTRFLASLLYGVKPTDPLTFIAVSLILIAVALLACYIPARRATKVDPMIALRYE